MATFPFWSRPVNEIAQRVNSSVSDLSEKDVHEALQRPGPNHIQPREKITPLVLFLN
jgi:Cation transporter/ATPase, N-terminus.